MAAPASTHVALDLTQDELDALLRLLIPAALAAPALSFDARVALLKLHVALTSA